MWYHGSVLPCGSGLRAGTALRTLVAVVLVGCTPGEQASGGRRPPSVILISIDALRRDHLGLYGYERDVSPGLDRFARECVVYDRAYSTAPWTLISHMTMLTGLYPLMHGVVDTDSALAPEIPTLSERLHERGHYTITLSKGGWVNERYGFTRGVDDYRRHDSGAELDRNLRAAMSERPRDGPFFLFVHVWDVHNANLDKEDATIFEPPEGYRDRFLPGAAERLRGIDASALWQGEVRATPEQIEAFTALYDGNVRYVDDLIGGWIEGWRAEGVLDESIVIVTSDHGESLFQRDGVNVSHGGMNEEGLRVPLLIRYPGARDAGARRGGIASHVDLVPTVLECLDVSPEPWLPGLALRRGTSLDRLILAERPPAMAALRWPWKVHWFLGEGEVRAFDLRQDPGELHPITARNDPETHARVEAEIFAAVARFRERWPSPAAAGPAGPEAKDVADELRGLGYTDR